jgi:hypothetical protein
MNTIRAFTLAALASVFLSPCYSADIPENLLPNVTRAEKEGHALFTTEASATDLHEDAVATAKKKITDFCDLSYKSVVVEHGGLKTIFFIAQSPKDDQTVFGRHYKVQGDKVFASTKGCLVIPVPPPGATAAAAWVTHLLSDTPTEFHTYLSLKHEKPVYVRTSMGMWKIENGKIELSEKAPQQ